MVINNSEIIPAYCGHKFSLTLPLVIEVPVSSQEYVYSADFLILSGFFFQLKVVYDCIPTPKKEVTVPRLKPGCEGEITVELVAPQKPGTV
jgi:hypothetical protein